MLKATPSLWQKTTVLCNAESHAFSLAEDLTVLCNAESHAFSLAEDLTVLCIAESHAFSLSSLDGTTHHPELGPYPHMDLNDPKGALNDLDTQAIFVQRNTANCGLSLKSRQRNLLSVDSQCSASD